MPLLVQLIGEFALGLECAQRALGLLQHVLELRNLLGHVIDDSLLFAEHFDVHPHVIEEMHDRVGLRVHLVDELATVVDRLDVIVFV